MSKIVLVHEEKGYTLKNGGVVLEGVTDVKRVMEDGVPVVEVEAVLARKEYLTDVPSAMVLVVGPEGESLKHGTDFIEGLLEVSEKDGVLKLKLEVDSEDYGPARAAKKAPKAEKKEAPKVEKETHKPVAKLVEKLED